jgi:hypothetical protein
MAHDQDVVGSNLVIVYWMDDAIIYYIKEKCSQMGHIKKYLKNKM